ncbi:MAG TPA: TetR/AcrR family transcriptional regulator [Burkholderiaceae bacterium]|nr:TetR/AcrR family transcriptional regulator [Burkholderiaceae bacterium]
MTSLSKKPVDWRQASSRQERSRLIREALFKAAADVVGERGYQDASITLITQRANVAQGTFYNHFESRQDILDQLLPALGKDMLAYIREQAKQGKTLIEREELAFRAFFSFLHENPNFFRILNEAESFAPEGYRQHLDQIASGYMRMLKRGLDNNELPGYEERELEVLAFIMMSARTYLGWRYANGNDQNATIPDWVTVAYSKFIRYGFSGAPAGQTDR